MKVQQFPGNGDGLYVEFHKNRTGPNYFLSFYKNTSRLHHDPKDCWRVLGVAKHTESGKALKEWCVEIFEGDTPKPDLDMEAIKATGFGPEAHVEPNDNTRTII